MSYWGDRMAQHQQNLSDKTIKEINKQLQKYYGRAMDRVIRDFEGVYSKLESMRAEGKEPTPADLYKLDKYWEAQAQMRRELQRLGDRELQILSKAFETNFFEVYYSIAIPGATAFNTIDKQGAEQLINAIWVADGKNWSQRIWENNELLAQTLNEEMVHIVASGKKNTDLKKVLQERFNVSYSRADALVRTEVAHVQTEAAKQRYKDYGIDQVEIWADPDERTCDVCGKLHEKRYRVGDQVPIPAHPRCRCCVIPVID